MEMSNFGSNSVQFPAFPQTRTAITATRPLSTVPLPLPSSPSSLQTPTLTPTQRPISTKPIASPSTPTTPNTTFSAPIFNNPSSPNSNSNSSNSTPSSPILTANFKPIRPPTTTSPLTFLPTFENLDFPILFDRIDKRPVSEKKTEMYAENEQLGTAIIQVAAAHPEEWYNAEIQQPKKTEVFYAIEDIYLPCTEKKCNKEIAHVQMHQPYKKGGRSDDNIVAHIVAGAIIEVVPSPKTPNIHRFNFVNMISDTVTPKVHFMAVPILGTVDNICTFNFDASQKVSPTQIVQVWWNYSVAVQLAGISEFNRLYRSLASVAAVRKASQESVLPDPILGAQSRLTIVNQYRFLHTSVESRTQFCETYLENTLQADIALEERNARAANALTAAHSTNSGTELNGSLGAAGGKSRDYEKRLEVLRARYIGYGESRAMHTQSQILERKKKRKDKMETERAEREKDKQAIVLTPAEDGGDSGVVVTGSSGPTASGKKRRVGDLQLSTSITKLVKTEDPNAPPSSPTPTSSPISTLHSSPTNTAVATDATPSVPKDLLLRETRGGTDDSPSLSLSLSLSPSTPASTTPTLALIPTNYGANGSLDKSKDNLELSKEIRESSKDESKDRETIRLMVELDFMTKKLEKKKSFGEKQKEEVLKLKQENEKTKELHKDAETKLGHLQEKYNQLNEKYQKAKELKRKYHDLELQYEKLKTKEELYTQFIKKDT